MRQRTDEARAHLAERLAAQLDLPVTIAGVLLVLVVVADGMMPAGSSWKSAWDVIGWLLWSLFVLEFVLRLIIAPSTSDFLRRNWWQAVFLLLPFLRFLRALTRGARVARAVSTSVRGARTAGRKLSSRMAWLGAVTIGVILASSQLLFEYGPERTYPDALHDAALATISGEPIGGNGGLVGTMDVVLAIYATVFFATLAGSIGAFLLERGHLPASSASLGEALPPPDFDLSGRSGAPWRR